MIFYLLLFNAVHDLGNRFCQLVDFHRSPLAPDFVLLALDPPLFLQVMHHNGHLSLAEVSTLSDRTGCYHRCFCEDREYLSNIPFDPYPEEKVYQLLLFSCKVHHIFLSHTTPQDVVQHASFQCSG